jgi:hypothetical protein
MALYSMKAAQCNLQNSQAAPATLVWTCTVTHTYSQSISKIIPSK